MALNNGGGEERPATCDELWQGFEAIELLQQDPRPTFIIDLGSSSYGEYSEKAVLFSNPALNLEPTLAGCVLGTVKTNGHANGGDANEYTAFRSWVAILTASNYSKDHGVSTYTYKNYLWTAFELKQRYRVVSGIPSGKRQVIPVSKRSTRELSQTEACMPSVKRDSQVLSNLKITSGETRREKELQWLDTLPDSPHVRVFKETDWSATLLGPIESWPDQLIQMVKLAMSDSFAACLLWGKDLVSIYNEAYVPVASRKHPTLMGSTLRQGWGEIADELMPSFRQAERLGYATTIHNAPFFLLRHGYLEETFFSWNLIPVLDNDKHTLGFYNMCFEVTKQNISERRTSTLMAMASTPDLSSYWQDVLNGFRTNELDVPLAVIYSVERSSDEANSTSTVHYQAALGISEGHPLAISPVDFNSSDSAIVRLLQKAVTKKEPLVLHEGDDSVPKDLLEKIDWLGYKEPSKTIVVFPLQAGEETMGFLLLGTNPRREFDEDYAGWIQLLSRQLSTSLTSAVIIEQGKRQQAKLSEDLAAEKARFRALTELNTAGLFYISLGGAVIYANDTWYEITNHCRDESAEMSFMDDVMEEDREHVAREWHTLTVLSQPRTFEVRLLKRWYHKDSDSWKNVTVLACCTQDIAADGSVKSVMGCATDISLQKQAQEDALDRAALSEQLANVEKEANAIQIRSRMEAEEGRKGMEKFMDITSHEMRNPLSAILQSADSIATALEEFQSSGKDAERVDDMVANNLDAVQIIQLCAQHQGRIINDVLTLSKLDSAMLGVSPTPTQPVVVARGALRMFDGELQSHDIQLEFVIEQSFAKMNIDWVMLDPSRVTQTLINLMTNAIKFTRSNPKRVITVSVGASTSKRSNGEHVEFDWFPSRGGGSKKDLTTDDEWGDGQPIFIYFAVQDTGRGLTAEEKTHLFERFAQANPRTHVKYGGSGLGLFISREITELHGGEFALASESGIGSTFAFYIKGRRTSAPVHEPVQTFHKRQRTGTLPSTISVSPLKHALPDDPNKNTSPTYHILLVEDNLVNQKVLSKQLVKAGCIVHVANHGEEALTILRDSNLWANGNEDEDEGNGHEPTTSIAKMEIDIVLMDLEMPVMDGLTCAKRIRELQVEGRLVRHVPLIAVTANARLEQVERSLRAGMDDVMAKPFRVPQLMPMMQRLKGRFGS